MNIKKNISYKKIMERKFILASNNNGKIREMKEKLNPLGITVISQKEAGYNIEVDETGTTFEENATLKAEAIYKLSKLPVISDDSGLEIDALNGEPGIYSARYAGENATDEDRRNKVLNLMKNVEKEKRTQTEMAILSTERMTGMWWNTDACRICAVHCFFFQEWNIR